MRVNKTYTHVLPVLISRAEKEVDKNFLYSSSPGLIRTSKNKNPSFTPNPTRLDPQNLILPQGVPKLLLKGS